MKYRLWVWDHKSEVPENNLHGTLNKLFSFSSVEIFRQSCLFVKYVVIASFALIKWKYKIKSVCKSSQMLKIISISICNEYFHVTKIIRATHFQTVCNIEPKNWSHIFWVRVLNPESLIHVLDPVFKIVGSRFRAPPPRS